MNLALSGVYLGKALAEGDMLGALPWLTELVSSVKKAAPNLIKQVASKQISALQTKATAAVQKAQTKYLGTPSEMTVVGSLPATTESASAARPNWIVPAAITLGGLFLFLYARKRSR